MKTCSDCGTVKSLDLFHKAPKAKDRHAAYCKPCHNIRIHKMRIKNRPHYQAYWKKYHETIRREALSHYSNGKLDCNCCGETEFKFLALDHINGGGNEQRKIIGPNLAPWVKRNNYPEGFQVLCHNCNMAKGLYGQCPHKETTNVQMVAA